MIKKILTAALVWPLLALAGTYPSPTFQNVTLTGSFTGTVGAPSINYGSGLNALSAPGLGVAPFGETPGSQFVASGGLTLNDNSSHAGHGHAAYTFQTTPVGTGAIGPLNADYAVIFSAVKQNAQFTTQAGEIDTAYFVARNGGTNSDTTAMLGDVAQFGTGFNAFYEASVSTLNSSGTVTRRIDAQSAVLNNRDGSYVGHVVSATDGALNAAYLAQNSSGASWSSVLQYNAASSGITFDMPISGGVPRIRLFDGAGGAKSLVVTSNCFGINNDTETTQVFSVCNTGNLNAIGSITGGAGSFSTLSASGNDALMYANTSGQSIPNNAATTVTSWTKTSDRVNANFNASTGTFTAPVTGVYRISAQLTWGSAAGVVSATYQANIVANGVTVAAGRFQQQTTASMAPTVTVNALVSVSAGQTIVIQALQTTGAAYALSSGAGFNFVSINRVP